MARTLAIGIFTACFLISLLTLMATGVKAESLDLGKVYCCRFDCPSRHCEDRPRGCYFIDKYTCLRWIGYGIARKVDSCDECPFARNDLDR